MYIMIFSFIWGLITSALGVGWFDGDLSVAATANLIPLIAVSLAPKFNNKKEV